MPRFTAGARAAGAGSTTLFSGSLFGTASRSGYLREVAMFNTTTTAVAYKLQRATAAGTVGATLTKDPDDPDQAAAGLAAFNTHTVAHTGTDAGYNCVLGAAIGAGVIFTLGDRGKRIPAGTANGIGILTATGTGQIIDFHFGWDE